MKKSLFLFQLVCVLITCPACKRKDSLTHQPEADQTRISLELARFEGAHLLKAEISHIPAGEKII